MLTRENFKAAADSSGGGGGGEANTNSEQSLVAMVDNNTMSSSGGVESVATTPNVDNHNKLILKLPKTTADQEVATSSSSSSSSSAVQSDTRKVEPLKINLLQHTNNNNNNNNNNNMAQLVVPKITIKPIFPQANSDTAISSDCSSSAEEEAQQRDSSVDSSSPSSPSEPHIVPKLTIRSAEEGGTAHSSIVPKLTIKMNESNTSNLTTVTTTTSSSSANNTHATLPPPLPKLTIKTMLDGSSGAIISSLSPASSSSSCSSSSGTATAGLNIVPKLTIKTNASGTCVSSTEEQQQLPKLTIKTGQEHAMIITQHSNDVTSMLSIPKMTIKTKTFRAEEDELKDLRDDEQVGKIPKLTIKANDDMAPLSPLVVRNLPQNESPDRVPKMMISRQQDNNLLAVNNHMKTNHCLDESMKISKKNNCTMDEQEKVPKLTIKHINVVVTEDSGGHETTTMNKSIPKLTIKNLSSPKLKMKAVLDEEKLMNCNDIPNNNNNNNSINNKSSTTDNQRDSDDMDIDEALQAHDPKIFNNVSTMFNDFGKSSTNVSAASVVTGSGSGLVTNAVRRVIDTVDLTASPERSPAHTTIDTTNIKHAITTPLLLERLQRDTSVIQTTMENSNSNTNTTINTSFLLNQLKAPPALPNLRHTSLPLAMNNRLFSQQQQLQPNNKNVKYPNLTERLLANGMHTMNTMVPEITNTLIAPKEVLSKTNDNVIDSIEILDTPDGSSQSSLDENASVESVNEPLHQYKNGIYLREPTIAPNKYANNDSPLHFTNDVSHTKTTDNFTTDLTPNKLRRVDKESSKKTSPAAEKLASPSYKVNNILIDEALVNATNNTNSAHRSRKQKHEHLLTIPMDEEDPLKLHPMHESVDISTKKTNNIATEASGATPVVRKRGRPKKNPLAATATPKTPVNNVEQSCKSRRVQLLRKRLAIDMVAAEQPFETEANEVSKSVEKDRSLRTPARAARNGMTSSLASGKRSGRRSLGSRREDMGNSTLHHFGGSNSSLSSGCSSSSLSSTTVTTTQAAQIDLTMSSSSSSANSCSQTTTTLTTVKSKNNTMLPPSKILSSDPVPDVVFKPNDFSSALVTQQFQMHNSGQSSEEIIDAELSSHSEESLSPYKTPTRGRGRGRGSRGTRGSANSGRGSRGGHRLGRGASAVAKAIAMSRPRCVGGLKHTPDPKRLKGLISPGPQVFEEDTRMSADLTQVSLHQQHSQHQSCESTQHSETNAAVRQLEFLTNDESQSSVISNTSILDPNTVAAMQNGAASVLKQRPKKKKMEVCVAEDTECNVSSIAEYDWPPPKGCCPSKNRDTFMIQEQVALYLGIKSFKRKYPDLPRRQIDMEERNWLQEKNLVSERMCDLGITAVWASDILDIMYADFYDKYEEYKDYVRQKHLREIEAKQKALGMNILGNGRNLQIRERAMLSASKWNSYCGRARKSERVACLDMQSFIVNIPIPITAPAHTMVNREMADIIADVAAAENIPEPPTLMPKRVIDMTPKIDKAYPLALIPGQFSENYKRFEPSELYALPLNTALMDITKLKTENDMENMNEAGKHKIREKRQKRRQRPTKLEDDSETESDSSYSSKGSCSLNSSTSSSCTSSDSDSSSSDNEEIIHRCGVCQRTQNSNLKALPETFIKCYSCARRVHPSCIEMPQRMVGRVRNYNWQCAGCKCCIKCKRSQDLNKMLFCEQCDRGYHIYCLELKTVPDGRWSCERCCVCMRCGATKPEGVPQQQLSPNSGEKVKQVKHKKVKWINEYRIDHITKLREHCSMLCVPCARAKPANKRVHIVTPPTNIKSAKINNTTTASTVASGTTSETNVIKTNKNNIVKINNSQSVSTTTTTNNISTAKITTTPTTTTSTICTNNNNKTTAVMQRVKQQQIKQTTNKLSTTSAATSSDVGDISLAGGTAIPPPPVVA